MNAIGLGRPATSVKATRAAHRPTLTRVP